MNGRLVGLSLILAAAVGGGGLYYTQVYAFYGEVQEYDQTVIHVASVGALETRGLPVVGFQAVDKDSSPLGYRACFGVKSSLAMMTETYELIENAVPLEAPGWFGCFNADEIGAALEEGRALAFLGTREIRDGVDRVVAVMDDGRGFAWHQLNEKYRD